MKKTAGKVSITTRLFSKGGREGGGQDSLLRD